MRITSIASIVMLLFCSSGVVQCSEKREEDKNNENNNNTGNIRGGSGNQITAENHERYTDLKPLAIDTMVSAHIPQKPKKNNQATTPRIHSELNRIHEENVKQRKRNLPANHNCIGQNRRQLLVTCSEGAEYDCLDELVQAGVEIIHMIPETIYFSICVDTIEEAELVANMTDVDGVEEDPIRTLSYLPGSQKRRNLAQQETPYGIDMVKAPEFWSAYGKQGEGVTVCVIDTGLLSLHEDIKDGDLNGSYDNDLETPWFEDGHSHGTHVTGTIAAVDNDKGVVGVAPKVEIYVARVFNGQGQFTASSLVAAFRDCEMAGSDIISMSLGGPSQSSAERNSLNALADKGILIVAAAGNSGNADNPVEYPAAYDAVMGVAALNRQERIADFSSHSIHVDISGPGVDVLSLTSESTSSYSEFSGTSMATPHVAGVGALLKSIFPNKSGNAIREALQATATDLGACGYDRLHGNGLVNAMAAAAYLDGGNQDALEQSGCYNAKITIKTDDWGAETSYVVSNKGSGKIVYKGGPYPNSQRATYTDNIQLIPDCYEFKILDSFGDGTNNEESGIGEFGVEFNNVQEIFLLGFPGFQTTLDFGCGGDSSPEPPSLPECGNGIVEAGEECDDGNMGNSDSCTNACNLAVCGDGFIQAGEQCDDGNTQGGDGCSASCQIETPSNNCPDGQALVELVLETDQYSFSENQIYFFEVDTAEEEFIWIATQYGLRSNRRYELEECVDRSGCYKFYFFDTYGDGFFRGGFSLKWDEEEVLTVAPYETGDTWQGGPTVYWTEELGQC